MLHSTTFNQNTSVDNDLPTEDSICNAHTNSLEIKYLFLVGGFAESPILQEAIRREFGRIMRVIIPQVNCGQNTYYQLCNGD